MSWLALKTEITVEFDELTHRHDALWRALEQRLARRAHARHAYNAARWHGMLPEERRRYHAARTARRLAVRMARPPRTCGNFLCRVSFVPVVLTMRYCSKRCRQRESTHRHYRSRRARGYYRSRRTRTWAERMTSCLLCKRRFERWRSDELYCTQDCQDAMHNQRRLAVMRAQRAPKPVVRCAVPGCSGRFVQHSIRQRYCSPACRRVGRKLVARLWRARARRRVSPTLRRAA